MEEPKPLTDDLREILVREHPDGLWLERSTRVSKSLLATCSALKSLNDAGLP
jgi:hypothetical protein